MDGLCRKTNENQHIPFRNETSSCGIIFYIKQAVNGQEKDTRSFGKLPIIWTCNLFLWITQTWQELTTAFTKFFILGTQYLDRVRRTTNWLPPCTVLYSSVRAKRYMSWAMQWGKVGVFHAKDLCVA